MFSCPTAIDGTHRLTYENTWRIWIDMNDVQPWKMVDGSISECQLQGFFGPPGIAPGLYPQLAVDIELSDSQALGLATWRETEGCETQYAVTGGFAEPE